jgi:hypothetical protein
MASSDTERYTPVWMRGEFMKEEEEEEEEEEEAEGKEKTRDRTCRATCPVK